MNAPTLLTVDDVPSALFSEKLDYLAKRGVPAVLFCWGEKVAGHEVELVRALNLGYRLGNHAWSHPRFSDLSDAEARDQVVRTEAVLDEVHRRAGVPRVHRYFRFPYLDRGRPGAQERALQEYLGDQGFVSLDRPADRFDSGCSFDQREYHYDGTNEAEILGRIGPGSPGPGDVILIHDHEATHGLFFRCLDQYRRLDLAFGLPPR